MKQFYFVLLLVAWTGERVFGVEGVVMGGSCTDESVKLGSRLASDPRPFMEQYLEKEAILKELSARKRDAENCGKSGYESCNNITQNAYQVLNAVYSELYETVEYPKGRVTPPLGFYGVSFTERGGFYRQRVSVFCHKGKVEAVLKIDERISYSDAISALKKKYGDSTSTWSRVDQKDTYDTTTYKTHDYWQDLFDFKKFQSEQYIIYIRSKYSASKKVAGRPTALPSKSKLKGPQEYAPFLIYFSHTGYNHMVSALKAFREKKQGDAAARKKHRQEETIKVKNKVLNDL